MLCMKCPPQHKPVASNCLLAVVLLPLLIPHLSSPSCPSSNGWPGTSPAAIRKALESPRQGDRKRAVFTNPDLYNAQLVLAWNEDKQKLCSRERERERGGGTIGVSLERIILEYYINVVFCF